jgi:hypothetical protein
MTLDEAIQHCKDEADKECRIGNNGCAKEHIQLAKWLMDYRRLKYNKK